MTVSTSFILAVTPYIEKECCFCFEDYKEDDKIYLLACQHLIHMDCLNGLSICPICRRDITMTVTEKEKGYGFYEALYQIAIENQDREQWTYEEIEEETIKLRNLISQHHEWNHHHPIHQFKNLCNLLQKPYVSRVEPFFQELIDHPRYRLLDRYLEDQWQRLSPPKEEPDPLWEAVSKVAGYFFCAPLQREDH